MQKTDIRSVVRLFVATTVPIGLMLFATPQSFAQQTPGEVIQGIQAPGATYTEAPVTPSKPSAVQVEDKTPAGSDAASGSGPSFFVNDVQVQGMTLLSGKGAEDAEALIKGYEGRDVNLTELKDLARKLTQLYRKKGYYTSRVFVPPQKISSGVVTLQVLESVVGQVVVEDGKYFKSRAVAPHLDVKAGEPLSVTDLQKSLRLINDNPDIKASATLKPGAQPGQTDVVVKITDSHPWHLTPFADNLGRNNIGTHRFGATFTDNNLLGFGDRLMNSYAWADNSWSNVTNYEVPIGRKGTRVGMSYAHSNFELGGDFKALGIDGTGNIFSPYVTQEWYSSDRYRFSTDLAFDVKNLNSDGLLTVRDKIRMLRFGANLNEFDNSGRTFLRQEFGLGLGWFGASDDGDANLSRTGAGGSFFKSVTSATRIQKMPWNTYGVFRGVAQLTPDQLFPSEQLQVGGAFSVRGYREGSIIGDNGFFLSSEWRMPFFLAPKSWNMPFSKEPKPIRDNLQLVTFADIGGAFVNDAITGQDDSEYVMGVGVGLRAKLCKFLVGRVDVGVPLFNQATSPSQARVHFGIQSDLF